MRTSSFIRNFILSIKRLNIFFNKYFQTSSFKSSLTLEKVVVICYNNHIWNKNSGEWCGINKQLHIVRQRQKE